MRKASQMHGLRIAEVMAGMEDLIAHKETMV